MGIVMLNPFKRVALLLIGFCLLFSAKAPACTNFPISVGVVDSVEGDLLGHIVSTMITERSGVVVGIKYFKTPEELDQAVKKKEVEIIIENTANALRLLGKSPTQDSDENFMTTKIIYQRDKGLIWLKPFGFRSGDGFTSPVVSRSILDKFPALPRVLEKLSGAIVDETFSQLVNLVKDNNKKPRRVARDFLSDNRLI